MVQQLLSTKEVCRILGVSRSTLHRIRTAGVFPEPVKIGTTSRYLVSEIDEFVERNAKKRGRSSRFLPTASTAKKGKKND